MAFIGMPFSVLIWCYVKIYYAMKRSKQRVAVHSVRHLTVPPSAEDKEKLKKEVSGRKKLYALYSVIRYNKLNKWSADTKS